MLNGLRSMFKAYQKFYPLYVTEDVGQAVSLVASKNIKVVLFDSYLFEGVTLEVLEKLKRLNPDVKCVLVTEKDQVSGAIQSCGADMVLAGSIASPELFSEMDQLLKLTV